MTSTTQIERLPLQVSAADSLRRNSLVLFLTTIIGFAGAYPLLLQKPEQENSSNYKSHSLLFAQANSNENSEGKPLNNGTPDSTDSTASVEDSGTPGNGGSGPGNQGTPRSGPGTGARPANSGLLRQSI
ncbi:MAG: hypothetical protein F6J93_18895 [Oscillatoria sp. SIO1A7]|nr:hypothetical protein [Oscillatoria sp. SIO1A7]